MDGDGFDDFAGATAGFEDADRQYTYAWYGGVLGARERTLLGGRGVDGPNGLVGAAGDLDMDGFLDVLGYWDGCSESSSGCAFYGSADGLSAGETYEPITVWPSMRMFAPGDVNGDGLPDVGMGRDQLGTDYRCNVYFGGDAGSWSAGSESDDNDALCYGADLRGDVNGDGYDDVVAGAPGDAGMKSYVKLWYGGPSGPAELYDQEIFSGLGNYYLGWAVTSGHVDGDDYADVVVGEPDAPGTVHLYSGSASGLVETWAFEGDDALGADVVLADFDGDGDSDLAVGVPGDTQEVLVWSSDGAGFAAWPDQAIYGPDGSSQFGWDLADAGDVNGDGAHDLLVGAAGSGIVQLYAGAAPDADGDGLSDTVDCAPDDPSRAPGVTEVCDGIDQDCDGAVDEDATDAGNWYTDADGDGHGSGSVTACEQPAGTVSTGDDCDDTDATSYPGAVEPCDGVDHDCDGAPATCDTGTAPPPPADNPETGCATAGGRPSSASPTGLGGLLLGLFALASRRPGAGAPRCSKTSVGAFGRSGAVPPRATCDVGR